MGDISLLGAGLPARIASRSLGLKLIVVCGLALLMTIPSFFVESLIDERTSRAAEVVKEVSGHVGGEQTILGPTLMIPYTVPAHSAAQSPAHGVYVVFPVRANAAVKMTTQERRRSLFKVPVFQADVQLDAAFDLAGVPNAAPAGAELDWNKAEIDLGISDARGALGDASMTSNGKTSILIPAEAAADISFGPDQNQRIKLTLFGAKVNGVAKPDAQFNLTSSLRLSGAERIALLAYGKSTHLKMDGDWPSPGFDGGFLPVTREVSSHGFAAEWSVPFIARGVHSEGQASAITGLDATALGVSFVEVADPYQSVNRSLKYIPLFLGLLFISYFVFEVTTSKRVHPAQYVLVGIAQIIFYLLLLSIAERIGFDLGFLMAGTATVLLLAANAGWIFSSRKQGMRALVIFGLLYGLIYMLLRVEDNALLIGAIASFLAVAAAMYFTRRVDWYSSLPGIGAQDPGAGGAAT